MNLVIVESPAKAKTINKYLGSDYTVLASYGHIRDLPSKNGSVDPENDFKMIWEIDSFSKKYLKDTLGSINDKGQARTEDGKSFVKEKLSQFLGDDRTSDAQNLERLAVNETILVYALANALKSKDRLTQKDIQNAKELVKVFSLGRGAKTTIRSLRALREILVDKYSSQERLYRLAGGDEGTLNTFKEAYKIIPGTATTEQGRVFGDLSQSDLLNQFGDIPG